MAACASAVEAFCSSTAAAMVAGLSTTPAMMSWMAASAAPAAPTSARTASTTPRMRSVARAVSVARS